MAITQSPFPKGDVVAVLNYFKAPEDGSAPFNYVNTPPEGQPQRNHGDDYKETLIHDIRGSESDFTLDRDSFLVVSGVPPSKETEFVDDASIEANYYPEVRDILLKNIPGSNKVLIFDHTIRRSDPKATRSPVLKVHIDQTAKSAALRVKRHLPDEAEKLLAGRYRIVNVWRPLNKKPVESSPLAFASSSTLKDSDVHPVSHRYANGYVGETAGIAHSPDQKWYFLSGMTGEERLLLQCFDSEALKENSEVQGGRLAHTAFNDPRTLPGAEGRESIEVRALVFGP